MGIAGQGQQTQRGGVSHVGGGGCVIFVSVGRRFVVFDSTSVQVVFVVSGPGISLLVVAIVLVVTRI